MKLLFLAIALELAGIVLYFATRTGVARIGSIDARSLLIVVVLGISFVAAWYIVLSNRYTPDVVKWACGIIGSIVGFGLTALKP